MESTSCTCENCPVHAGGTTCTCGGNCTCQECLAVAGQPAAQPE